MVLTVTSPSLLHEINSEIDKNSKSNSPLQMLILLNPATYIKATSNLKILRSIEKEIHEAEREVYRETLNEIQKTGTKFEIRKFPPQ